MVDLLRIGMLSKRNPVPHCAAQKKHYFYQYVGRGEKIRTSDPLHPMQVRYQAALRPDRTVIIATYTSLQLTIEHRHDAF